MMHRWGPHLVSSALEVYVVLVHAPGGKTRLGAWEYQLALEPPTWGGPEAARAAYALASRGLLVWTWDDFAVVFSRPNTVPPRGVIYRSWEALRREELRASYRRSENLVASGPEFVPRERPQNARLESQPEGGERLCFDGFHRGGEPTDKAPLSLEERADLACSQNEFADPNRTKGTIQ